MNKKIFIIVLLFILLICLTIVSVSFIPEGIKRSEGNPPEDFFQYYVQSVRLINGEKIYQSSALHNKIREDIGWEFEDVSPANPPFFVLFSLPFSLLPYPLAWWSLIIFSVLVIFFTSFAVSKNCGYKPTLSVCFGIAALCTFPTAVLLILNHIESVLLLVLVAGWIFFKKGKNASGAIMWGVAASIKLFPALYLVPLINHRYRKIGNISIAVALFATALGGAIIGWDQTIVYFFEIIPSSRSFYSSYGNFSVLAAGTVMNSAVLGWGLEIFIGTFLFITLLWNPGSIDKIFVTATAGSLLLSPLSWSYYFIIIPPVLIVFSGYLSLNQFQDRLLIYFLILTTLFWPSFFGGWTKEMFQFFPKGIGKLLTCVPTGGLLFLFFMGLNRVK